MELKHQVTLNILLADDDADDCFFFKTALEKLQPSAQLTTVHDGEELMKFLSQNPEQLPDVLFLDINMPRKNGIECLSEIKHNAKLKNIPVVMFSTNKSQDTMSKLFKGGANIYITKPADFTELVQLIGHAIPIASEQIFLKSKLNYILNA